MWGYTFASLILSWLPSLLPVPHKGVSEQSSCCCLSFPAKCAVPSYWAKFPLHEIAVLGLHLRPKETSPACDLKWGAMLPNNYALGALGDPHHTIRGYTGRTTT